MLTGVVKNIILGRPGANWNDLKRHVMTTDIIRYFIGVYDGFVRGADQLAPGNIRGRNPLKGTLSTPNGETRATRFSKTGN